MDSKMVNMSSQPFAKEPVISLLIISLVTPLIQAKEDNQQYVTKIAPMLLGCFISLYVQFWSYFKRLTEYSPDFTSSNNNCIYMEAAGFVATSYVSLLFANWTNIWLAIFPIIAIGFILALCYELRHQRSNQPDDGKGNASSGGGVQGGQDEIKLAEVHKAAALVPYWLLCVMWQFHTAENFAVSQFLLFFSSMLGALTLMLKQLALTAGAPPGIAPASVLLRKASLVVLLVTVHTFSAELLGENVMLFIIPEIVPVILWFSLSLNRRDSSYITADKIRAQRSVITVLGAAVVAVFAFLAFSMDEFVLSWCIKAMVSCGVSGLLLYHVALVLCQWPELDSRASSFVEEAFDLLMLWANVLLNAAAGFLAFALLGVVRLGLHKQMLAQPVKFFSDYVARYLNS